MNNNAIQNLAEQLSTKRRAAFQGGAEAQNMWNQCVSAAAYSVWVYAQSQGWSQDYFRVQCGGLFTI